MLGKKVVCFTFVFFVIFLYDDDSNRVEWADTINEEGERPFEKQPLLRSESRLSEKNVSEAVQGGKCQTFVSISHKSID